MSVNNSSANSTILFFSFLSDLASILRMLKASSGDILLKMALFITLLSLNRTVRVTSGRKTIAPAKILTVCAPASSRLVHPLC
jgi:hypothetical protein